MCHRYIKLLYEYECFKRKKRVDPLIIQSANRLDDYNQEHRHEKENKQHASSQRKYPREQEVVIPDDGDGIARPKYREVMIYFPCFGASMQFLNLKIVWLLFWSQQLKSSQYFHLRKSSWYFFLNQWCKLSN